MNKKMKMMIMISLMLVLVFITACGNNNNANKPAAQPDAPKVDAPKVDAPVAAPAIVVPLGADLPEDIAKTWVEVVQAAEAEGEVSIVSHNASEYQVLIDAFKKVFPKINVKLMSMPPQDFAPRIVSEQQNNQFLFDIVIGPASNVTSVMIPADTLAELPPNLILPDVTDDSKWNGGFGVYTTEKPYVVVYNRKASGGIFVNREFITEAQVSSLKDLIKPELKGKIVNYDMTRLAGGAATLATIAKREGEPFLQELIKQDIVNATDARILVQWVVQGKYPITLNINTTELDKFQKEGVGKEVVKLDDAYLVDNGVGVLKNAPNPNATKVFVNWLLSREGQLATLAAEPSNNSRRNDIDVQYPPTYPDYDNIGKYVNMSDPKEADAIKRVIELYKSSTK